MIAARGQVEEVGAAASQPGPWTVGPGGAKFGENIFGRAGTDDLEPDAATEVIEFKAAGPITINSIPGSNKLILNTPYVGGGRGCLVIISANFDAVSTRPDTFDTSYLMLAYLGNDVTISDELGSKKIGGTRKRYSTSMTLDITDGQTIAAALFGGYNTGGYCETTFWDVEILIQLVKA